MDDIELIPKGARRARRMEKHRRIVRRTSFVLFAFAVLVAAGLYVTDTVRLTVGKNPSEALSGPTTTFPSIAGKTNNVEHRSLSSDDPLRLWIGGDSLVGAFGPALGELTAEKGVVAPVYDARPSSGISNPEFYDWPKHGAESMTKFNPEVVVFFIGTNDFPIVPKNTSAWRPGYEEKVDQMMDVLTGSGRSVYWIGAPIMRSESMSERLQEINDVARDRAALREDVVYIDAYKIFTDSRGLYSRNLIDADAELVTVRADDGIHLTPNGGERLAQVVYELLDRQWRIGVQADPDNPAEVIAVRTSGTSASKSGGSGGSNTKSSSTTRAAASATSGVTSSTSVGSPPSSPESTASPSTSTATTPPDNP